MRSLRDDFERDRAVTYIGPRAFVIGFATICAAFLAVVFGLTRLTESPELPISATSGSVPAATSASVYAATSGSVPAATSGPIALSTTVAMPRVTVQRLSPNPSVTVVTGTSGPSAFPTPAAAWLTRSTPVPSMSPKVAAAVVTARKPIVSSTPPAASTASSTSTNSAKRPAEGAPEPRSFPNVRAMPRSTARPPPQVTARDSAPALRQTLTPALRQTLTPALRQTLTPALRLTPMPTPPWHPQAHAVRAQHALRVALSVPKPISAPPMPAVSGPSTSGALLVRFGTRSEFTASSAVAPRPARALIVRLAPSALTPR